MLSARPLHDVATPYPVLASARPRAAGDTATLSGVRVLRDRGSDGMALARLEGEGLDPSVVRVFAVTGGMRATLRPEYTRHGNDLIVGVDIEGDCDSNDHCAVAFEVAGQGLVAVVAIG